MIIQGQVIDPTDRAQSDGNTPNVPMGAMSEVLVGELVGKYHNLAMRGVLFIGSTALAGTIVPVNASNLVSTFTLWNPLGSGKNLAVIAYDLGIAGTTTAVIGSISFVYQAGIGAAIVIPTSQTALTPTNALVGAGEASVARLLSAGTLTGTPSVLMNLGISFGTTGASPGPVYAHREFDGTLILPPGVLITTVSTAAQTQPFHQGLIWAELPA